MRFVRVGVFWRRDAVGLDGDPRGGGVGDGVEVGGWAM